MRYCHERGEEHDFDRVPGRMNAARHCTKCPCISLDWDDVEADEADRRALADRGARRIAAHHARRLASTDERAERVMTAIDERSAPCSS